MSSYKLYYMAGACSMAVHVLLNELQQPFELIKARSEAGEKTAEFLAVNSRGQVPVLVTSAGQTIREGAAILTYLCETHASTLLPASGNERTTAQEWLAFANSTLHPAYGAYFFLNAQKAPAELTDAALARINTLWADVEKQLGTSPFIAGSSLTVADILLTVIANWVADKTTLGPKTKQLLATVTARPSYQKALAAEQVTYKAAA